MSKEELRDAALSIMDRASLITEKDQTGLLQESVTLAREWLATNPGDAPDWYSKNEIDEWLRRKSFSSQIATELAGIIALNHQLAFNKGFEVGKRTTNQLPE